jgi:DNA-binding transcriptional LysR family regulator
LGYERELVAWLPGGFATAIALARSTDLIATVPERHTSSVRGDMHGFELPVAVPPFTVSLLWHPRFDADTAHQWLRNCVRNVCGDGLDVRSLHKGTRAGRSSPHRRRTQP